MFIRVISLILLLSYSHLSISVEKTQNTSCKSLFSLTKSQLKTSYKKIDKHALWISSASQAVAAFAGGHLIVAMRDSLTLTDAMIFLVTYPSLFALVQLADEKGIKKIKDNMKNLLKKAYPDQFKEADFDSIYKDSIATHKARIYRPKTWLWFSSNRVPEIGNRIRGMFLATAGATNLLANPSMDHAFLLFVIGVVLGVEDVVDEQQMYNVSFKNFKNRLTILLMEMKQKKNEANKNN